VSSSSYSLLSFCLSVHTLRAHQQQPQSQETKQSLVELSTSAAAHQRISLKQTVKGKEPTTLVKNYTTRYSFAHSFSFEQDIILE